MMGTYDFLYLRQLLQLTLQVVWCARFIRMSNNWLKGPCKRYSANINVNFGLTMPIVRDTQHKTFTCPELMKSLELLNCTHELKYTKCGELTVHDQW